MNPIPNQKMQTYPMTECELTTKNYRSKPTAPSMYYVHI